MCILKEYRYKPCHICIMFTIYCSEYWHKTQVENNTFLMCKYTFFQCVNIHRYACCIQMQWPSAALQKTHAIPREVFGHYVGTQLSEK